LPHRERKKDDQQVKLGHFNSRVIGTWDLTDRGIGGMEKTAGAEAEELLRAAEELLERGPVVMVAAWQGGPVPEVGEGEERDQGGGAAAGGGVGEWT
jgi:hypothetical protein